jgi:hypothetical protein
VFHRWRWWCLEKEYLTAFHGTTSAIYETRSKTKVSSAWLGEAAAKKNWRRLLSWHSLLFPSCSVETLKI